MPLLSLPKNNARQLRSRRRDFNGRIKQINASASNPLNADELKAENARLLEAVKLAEEAEVAELKAENLRLHEVLLEKWASLAEPERESFRSQHADLRDSAQKIGVFLPVIGDPNSVQVQAPSHDWSNGTSHQSESSSAQEVAATTVSSGEPAQATASAHVTGPDREDSAPAPEQSNGSGGGIGEAAQTSATAPAGEDVEIVKEVDGTVSFKFNKLVDMVKNLGSPQGEAPQASRGSSRGEGALVQSPQGTALSGPRYAKGWGRRRVQASAESSDVRRGTRTAQGQPSSAKAQVEVPKNGSTGGFKEAASEHFLGITASNGKKRKEAEIVAEEVGGGAEDTATRVEDGDVHKANGVTQSAAAIVEREVGGGAEVDGGVTPQPTAPRSDATAHPLLELAVTALLEGDAASYEAAVSKVLEEDSEPALAKLRTAISDAVDKHDPAVLTFGKPDWRYFVFPHVPLAGSNVSIYVNKATNDIIRHSLRVQVHALFNEWELCGPNGEWFDLQPVEGASTEGGADWWSITIPTPVDAFDLNYVFGDGDGNFDNNGGLDYKTLMYGTMTEDRWEELQPDRQAAEELRRAEVERIQREEAAAAAEVAALQQDKARAEARAAAVIADFTNMQQGAVSSSHCWHTKPEVLKPATRGKIFYNAAQTSLGFMSPLPLPPTLRIGHNGWRDVKDVQFKKAELEEEGDWWTAEIEVPEGAAVLNFVVQYYDHFDNNGGLDYKLAVGLPEGIRTQQEWHRVLSEKFEEEEFVRRKTAEAEWARKCQKRAEQRAATKAKAKEVARMQMKHVLFTEPAIPAAGEELTLYYNPNNTCLHGHDRIFLKGGWNRWSHKQKFGPLEMIPPGPGEEHYRASVTVPKNAYRIDFVFSDVQDGPGTYDNRGGLDYGIPVDGCVIREPSLYVVHIAVEMAPICKVGGLGDVVTALGRAVQEEGNMVEVILPRYNFFLQSPLLGATVYETEFDFRGTHVWVSTCVVENLRCFFIEPANGFFAVDSVYGRSDDAMRFDWFCAAALEFLLQSGRQPDILHCHDWSTAPVASLYWHNYHHFGLGRPRVVFTIHNAEYGLAKIGAAAHHSQRFTTVSPKYREDICGLPAIANEFYKFVGIRNGIDCDIWDPENDQFLPMPYSARNVVEGKKAARDALRYRLGLTGWGDKPVVGVVSRLTAQKGIHLIKHAAYRTLERGGQFVLLGSAPDPKVQGEFNALSNQLRSENAAFCFSYDEPLSHLIYAGCDLIVVPSMFEPCGLTQMIAMRYGSVPVVRHTGGLYDTVFDVDNDKGRAAWQMEGSVDYIADGVDETNGFAFEGTDPMALDYALNRALDAYYNDRTWFHSLARRVMKQDWSWARPALDYIELYYQALKVE